MKKMKRLQQLIPILSALLVGIASGTTAEAQGIFDKSDLTPVQQELVDEAGSVTVAYWNEHLNEYKRTIDAVLSDADRERLDRMRVRFAILIEEVGATLNSDLSEDAEGTTVEVEGSLDLDSEEGNKGWELMELWTEAMALGLTYDEGLAQLEDNFFSDVADFGVALDRQLDRFIEEHRAEIAGDEKGRELMANRPEISTQLANLADIREEAGPAWGLVVRPLIMLFNGGDLRDLLPPMAGGTSDATTGVAQMAAILPTDQVLGQNYPNPAADVTTLPIDLPISATGAELKIFDAEGSLVRVDDLGPLPAGASTVDVQVGSLSSGSYLYQLVLTAGETEQVYANVMRVVR